MKGIERCCKTHPLAAANGSSKPELRVGAPEGLECSSEGRRQEAVVVRLQLWGEAWLAGARGVRHAIVVK